jgi:hypothetical protein
MYVTVIGINDRPRQSLIVRNILVKFLQVRSRSILHALKHPSLVRSAYVSIDFRCMLDAISCTRGDIVI